MTASMRVPTTAHLCRAQVRLDRVTLLDERDGSQSNALIELRKDAVSNKAEISKLLAAHSASFPAKLEAGKWYTLVVETVGEEMRVTIDGKPSPLPQISRHRPRHQVQDRNRRWRQGRLVR